MSMVGVESVMLDTWLQTRLAGDATLMGFVSGVFSEVAPLNQAYPFVAYQSQVNSDVTTLQGVRILGDNDYIVKVLTRAGTWTADQIAAVKRIHVLLNGVSNIVVSGGYVLGCKRIEQYRLSEQHEGQVIRHLGGRYKFYEQSL